MPVMQKINDNLIRRFCRILRHMSGVMSVLYIYIYKSAARRFFPLLIFTVFRRFPRTVSCLPFLPSLFHRGGGL